MAGRSRIGAAALLGLCLGVACKSKPTLMVSDTEGRRFEARCKKDQCELTQVAGPRADTSTTELRTLGRTVAACDGPPGAAPSNWDCRVLVCQGDAECPPEHGLAHGQCLSGLCSDAANVIGIDDAVALCLAGTGLGRSAPAQVDRYALGMNCGQPCVVPKPCRQP